MDKPEDKMLLESIEKLLVNEISPDASLDMLKEKQAEMISKGRELTKKLAIRKRELNEYETIKDLAEKHYYFTLDESNKEKIGREKLTDKQLTRHVEYLVNLDEGRKSKDIYNKIRDVTNKIDTLMLIWRRNDQIADRIENMLNAEINISHRLKK